MNFCVIPDAHTATGTLRFLPQIVERINALEIQPDFVMSLGDSVSGHEQHQVLDDAVRYQQAVSNLKAPHYYVIGNHECIPVEVYKLLTWEELLGAWNMTSRWYSFDVKRFHVCVLDGWISLGQEHFAEEYKREQEWLFADLAGTDLPTVVFVHQAVGFQQEDCPDWVETDNRKFWPASNFFEKTLEANAGKIVGVFEGHKHKALHKTRNAVTYHQMGASHAHNGQFAQVFFDAESGSFFVQAHPHLPEAEQSGWSRQVTYGDEGLLD